jgi:hypothetical protein
MIRLGTNARTRTRVLIHRPRLDAGTAKCTARRQVHSATAIIASVEELSILPFLPNMVRKK